MDLKDLEIYKLAKELSENAWGFYELLDWQDKKTMGDQFLTATDSIAANIAEGFGRYHYSDKNKFNYNARGSLLEALHWLELLNKRGKIKSGADKNFNNKAVLLSKMLNSYINSTKAQKLKEPT